MPLTVQCGACGKPGAMRMVGCLEFRMEAPWRSRNADIGSGKGAFVALCSDVCESRYDREIGLKTSPDESGTRRAVRGQPSVAWTTASTDSEQPGDARTEEP